MGNPVYDLILLVHVMHPMQDPQMRYNWQVSAEKRRQQWKNKGKCYRALKVPISIVDIVDPQLCK
jgi:hypothetical protein